MAVFFDLEKMVHPIREPLFPNRSLPVGLFLTSFFLVFGVSSGSLFPRLPFFLLFFTWRLRYFFFVFLSSYVVHAMHDRAVWVFRFSTITTKLARLRASLFPRLYNCASLSEGMKFIFTGYQFSTQIAAA